ncbi:unnamed protein product [Vitrella brassicaformis CCMP3155]|uniref:Uncharacterized protein n=1 Tax=Vitrella brassicaformis (strain CCMP3155) TaxID=1169540 RepID=A0A0G4GSE4_VITBC|nr:unnamed protein product [Vitrella brassicaformis CCMP3155]|eukprot:CEM33356.1 unnamed protein product [Vitrella brassicaformis CCMP3155]
MRRRPAKVGLDDEGAGFKLPLLKRFCGINLILGVAIVGLINLLYSITVISLMSNRDKILFFDIPLPPSIQLALAAWSLVGITVVIAGVWGAYYGVYWHVRLYYYYLLIGWAAQALCHLFVFAQGAGLCVLVPESIKDTGGQEGAVCGLLGLGMFLVDILINSFWIYAIWTVWSVAEHIQATEISAFVAKSALLDPEKQRLLLADRYAAEGPSDSPDMFAPPPGKSPIGPPIQQQQQQPIPHTAPVSGEGYAGAVGQWTDARRGGADVYASY